MLFEVPSSLEKRLIYILHTSKLQRSNYLLTWLRPIKPHFMKKIFRYFLPIIVIFGFTINNIFSQSGEPDTITIVVGGIDSLIYESPTPVELKAISVIRLSSTAKVQARWTAPTVSVTGYTVRYKLLGASTWTSGTQTALTKLISSLQLDTVYNLEIIPTGLASGTPYQVSTVFSTHIQPEPIVVSHAFFNQLAGWFANDSPTRTFCEFMDDVDIDLYEKLSFIQKYAFDNEAFSDGGSSTNLTDWYPSRFSSLDEDSCLPEWVTDCRCQVISDGSNHARPGKVDGINGVVIPKVVQKIARNKGKKTFIDRYEAGAAKFIALRQDDSGGMDYEMSSSGKGNDTTAATAAVSEIQFFLGCLSRDEGRGINTNLPEECDCERPLHVSYDYTTHLLAMGEKKGCPWNKGAAAQAEDMAIIVALDMKTGQLTPLDAGKYMVSRRCDSAWNPDWWIALLDVGGSVLKYYVGALDTTVNFIPTSGAIDTFISALQTLIGTPFANQSGSCGSSDGYQTLVHGTNHLTLVPNHPIRIDMFSSYYVRTRGYGCWRAKAGIASDYYLLGVVESEETEDYECCAEKFATYIVGSQQFDSAPAPAGESDVEVDAINDIPTRLGDVAFDLDLYGSWYNHHENPLTGYIDDLVFEFDRLYGPSCDSDYPLLRPQVNYPVIVENPVGLVTQNLTIDLTVKESSTGTISLLDMSGKLVKSLYSGSFSLGTVHKEFETNSLPSGSYIVNCNIGGYSYSYPLLLLNR